MGWSSDRRAEMIERAERKRGLIGPLAWGYDPQKADEPERDPSTCLDCGAHYDADRCACHEPLPGPRYVPSGNWSPWPEELEPS